MSFYEGFDHHVHQTFPPLFNLILKTQCHMVHCKHQKNPPKREYKNARIDRDFILKIVLVESPEATTFIDVRP
jgi:hypothetical protein